MQSIKQLSAKIGAGATLALVNVQAAAAADAVQVPNPIGKPNLGGVIFGIVNALLIFAGAVAVLFLIIGGFRYVVSTGNPEQVEGAKKTILYAILGLIIIFVAYVLVVLIQDWLKVDANYNLAS